MLPSLVALNIQNGLRQFLINGFEPSDSFFHGLMSRFVEDGSRWVKGPYLQVGLPYRIGALDKDFFAPRFALPNPGYTHQESAWERLCSDRRAAHTLVATGTGSGKTECFLYPVLDHCARTRAGGEAGIKVLVIYPMNALASDQARRFAQTIATTPAFVGVRVGLFVGGQAGAPGSGMVMGPDTVITDRETMRQNPPDVLLTNYKMLDYLLMRPWDRQLWKKNQPETLRYVVVDELHTFDGAQGTDLALLLRRLRSRLETPEDHLICAGTSATLGSSADTAPLREYARQVFCVPFEESSVITETRCTAAEFLGESPIEHVLQPRPDLADLLSPARYATPEEALVGWYCVFFADTPAPADVRDPVWRAQLGEMLKRHLLFVNLLKLLKGGVGEYATLLQQMQRPLPEAARPHARQVMDALMALVAWARDPDGSGRPLVTVRVQLWMRELRRMVARLCANKERVELRAASELRANRDGIYLPLVQCTECLTTGWLARLPAGSQRLRDQLDEIYNTWFRGQTEIARMYPVGRFAQPQVEGNSMHVCASCGNVQPKGGECAACGATEMVAVFFVTGKHVSRGGEKSTIWHDNTCPACGAEDRQILLGARSATLGSQIVEQTWASPFNDDKKLIAFSDSVQDAAHRAGFFGARTYLNGVRTAIAKALDVLPAMPIVWGEFLQRFPALYRDLESPLYMTQDRFVVEFLGPNMTWQRDWSEELTIKGVLPAGSRLPERVEKRLAWQAFAEFTYWGRGRNLEKLGKATLAPDAKALEVVAQRLLSQFHEGEGVRGLDESVLFQWLWGFLYHLRRRGGVVHPELSNYLLDGDIFRFVEGGGRKEWLPPIGERTPHPVFLTLGGHRFFDSLTTAPRKSWYTQWAQAHLGQFALLAPGVEEALYRRAIRELAEESVLLISNGLNGDAVGLNPNMLRLHADVVQLIAPQGKRRLTVPRELAERLRGIPCVDAVQESYEYVFEGSNWLAQDFSRRDLRRVIAAEHTGLLERKEREQLEIRFKSRKPEPWYENLLSATPTLEMGVDIGDLSAVMLCSVPPNQSSYLQRIGRAGRRDGNAVATTLAEGNSPHDLYFYEETDEMLSGDVTPPGIFLRAAEVLRRQLFAFCMDAWVASGIAIDALPEKTSAALDAFENRDPKKFPSTFLDYILRNEPRLLEGFQSLLADDVDETVRNRLKDAMQGTEEVDSLRQRTTKVLEELSIERKSHRKKADQLKARLAALRAKPQDEATKHEIEELNRERDKSIELAKEINSRDLLNTLTDAGLIPNYAFPEAGVELKSVLWRRAGSDEGAKGKYITLNAFKYERPATSALSEFAPENRFYANQRRVEVDQINMSLSKLEWWRMCPNCSHMENLALAGDHLPACPKCESAGWQEIGQKRQLLRFRQAIANSDDTKVRIDDSAEDREPRFYVRQLLTEFDAKDVRVAWRLKSDDLPFGFEFISRAVFRDVNFGELGKPGDAFKVADREAGRPGFKLCRHCGKVQKPTRRSQNDGPRQLHAFDCEKRDAEDPESIVECLYLYREFASEALRILVPYTRAGVDESVIQSFMAALQLGLKKRFGGRVDHLRLQPQDEPAKDGGTRRQYVVLYDSVPGGTGYLHQLLAQDAATLCEVLRLALQSLNDCSCNQDPEKDGCYRCLYQYRLGRMMDLVSRDRAKQVLGELVGSLHQMEKVPTISDIYINPNFDSVLERAFLESIVKLNKASGMPRIRLVQEVVNSKSGYLLEVDSQRYWIEPQVDLVPDDGIAVASRPDFVLWPVKAGSGRRPIALFCDGWTYHRESLREDAAKRSAIVTSGKFWVWTVTHSDVKAALEGDLRTDLESPLVSINRNAGEFAQGRPVEPRPSAFAENAVVQLIRLLALRDSDNGDPAEPELRKNGIWATFLMLEDPRKPEYQRLVSDSTELWRCLPDWMQEKPIPSLAAGSRDGSTPAVRYWFAGKSDAKLMPGIVIHDDATIDCPDQEALLAWRRWVWLYNTLQALPGVLLVTRVGMERRDYDVLMQPAAPRTSTGTHQAMSAGWNEVLELVIEGARNGAGMLAEAGAPPPDHVGYEHSSDAGSVLAEAELAWIESRLVVIVEGQREYEETWKSLGWGVIVVEGDWPSQVLERLSVEKQQ
jgi:DEAD/DEAH box helicase domain-containing protein